jgi:hypothetical protein
MTQNIPGEKYVHKVAILRRNMGQSQMTYDGLILIGAYRKKKTYKIASVKKRWRYTIYRLCSLPT